MISDFYSTQMLRDHHLKGGVWSMLGLLRPIPLPLWAAHAVFLQIPRSNHQPLPPIWVVLHIRVDSATLRGRGTTPNVSFTPFASLIARPWHAFLKPEAHSNVPSQPLADAELQWSALNLPPLPLHFYIEKSKSKQDATVWVKACTPAMYYCLLWTIIHKIA